MLPDSPTNLIIAISRRCSLSTRWSQERIQQARSGGAISEIFGSQVS